MDIERNELVEIFPTGAAQVDEYDPDVSRPQLLNFTIDFDKGFLVLTFNETVQESTIDARQLTLQDPMVGSSPTMYPSEYTLTGGVSNSDNGPLINISFTLFDFNELKRLPFCTMLSDCYLSFPQDLVMDMVNLPVIPTEPIPPAEYISDDTDPELQVFTTLDLNTESLVLQFSETVNIASLNFSALSLKTLFDISPLERVRFTGGSVPQVNTSVLNISLSSTDLDAIKLASEVCTYRGDCYIDFDANFITDMNDNRVTPIQSTFPGFLVQMFQRDTIN